VVEVQGIGMASAMNYAKSALNPDVKVNNCRQWSSRFTTAEPFKDKSQTRHRLRPIRH